MRKVQIQNMEHDASERDLVIIEQKDGKAAAHMVKPGRALLMQIEPKALLAIGDHVPNGLLDAKQPEADPTPPPSPEDVELNAKRAAWLALGEGLGWPDGPYSDDPRAALAEIASRFAVPQEEPAPPPTPEADQWSAEEQEALTKAGAPAIEPNRIPDPAPADPLDHDADGKKGGSKAKKAKG